jgi:hypothetical protein
VKLRPGHPAPPSAAAGASYDVSYGYERPSGVGRALTALPRFSDVDLLGDGERVVDLNTEIPDRALHLGVPKEQLSRAEVPGSPIDQGRLGSPP